MTVGETLKYYLADKTLLRYALTCAFCLFPVSCFHLCSELGAVTLTHCQYFLILLNENNLPAKSDPENLVCEYEKQ